MKTKIDSSHVEPLGILEGSIPKEESETIEPTSIESEEKLPKEGENTDDKK